MTSFTSFYSVFLVFINSDNSNQRGSTEKTWYNAEAFGAFKHVACRQGKYITVISIWFKKTTPAWNHYYYCQDFSFLFARKG